MLINTKEYLSIVENIKNQIMHAQQRAIAGANREMVTLYWNIGKLINDKKSWGDGFIENLARDIRSSFQNLRGFSERNLRYMSKFANIYDDLEILQHLLQNLPWRLHIVVMDKVKDDNERKWYLQSAIENGWSSNILAMQIDSRLYERQIIADKTTNFKERLPTPQSDLAQQTLKDPYIFDFVEYRKGMVERDVEGALVANITKLLLELGTGFSFVGQQYHLEIGGRDFYIDLLFYHLKLKCFIVLELKTTEFEPEYAGKLNFYISAVDDLLKDKNDNPTIGLLLCREKNKAIVKYALKDIEKPISVNEYKLLENLPEEYADILPTAEDIENRIKLPDISDYKE